MSKIAWLNPQVRIYFLPLEYLEIVVHVGVVPDFKHNVEISVYPFEMRYVASFQMWEDSAVDDEVLVGYIEDAFSDLGMGVMLLEEAPAVHFELYSREDTDG